MRSLLAFMIVLNAPPALAAPATEADFEQCKQRRHDLVARAMLVSDANERGELLAQAPTCHRNADGSVDVTEGAAVTSEGGPFVPTISAALRAGGSRSGILSNRINPAGFGPYIELEASYQLQRHFAAAIAGGFTSFHDSMAYDAVQRAVGDVKETSYAVVVRANLAYGRLMFGGGIGGDYERFPDTGYTQLLPCVEVHGGVTVAHAGAFDAQVFATVTEAHGLESSGGETGEVVSARVGLGLVY